jgi:hypothetical protein
MKGTSKITKSKEMKTENGNGKETDAQESSTPEISARSRQSLDGGMAQRDDEKEIEIQQLRALLQEQNEQLEQTQQALQHSQTERLETRRHTPRSDKSCRTASPSRRDQTSTNHDSQDHKILPIKQQVKIKEMNKMMTIMTHHKKRTY